MEYAAVSCAGMHLVYDGMLSALAQTKLPTTLDVVEAAVRTRGIKHYGKRVDVSPLLNQAKAGFEAVVMDEANRVFGQKRRYRTGSSSAAEVPKCFSMDSNSGIPTLSPATSHG